MVTSTNGLPIIVMLAALTGFAASPAAHALLPVARKPENIQCPAVFIQWH